MTCIMTSGTSTSLQVSFQRCLNSHNAASGYSHLPCSVLRLLLLHTLSRMTCSMTSATSAFWPTNLCRHYFSCQNLLRQAYGGNTYFPRRGGGAHRSKTAECRGRYLRPLWLSSPAWHSQKGLLWPLARGFTGVALRTALLQYQVYEHTKGFEVCPVDHCRGPCS